MPANFRHRSANCTSRMELEEVHAKELARRAGNVLPIGGFKNNACRFSAKKHAWEATKQWQLLQQRPATIPSYGLWKRYSKATSSRIQSICAICWTSNLWAVRISVGRGGELTSNPQAFRDAGYELGRAAPEAHMTLNIAMNRHRRENPTVARGARIRHMRIPLR